MQTNLKTLNVFYPQLTSWWTDPHGWLCLVTYAVIWQLGFHVSMHYETIPDIVSWFLPAGIRASFLLFSQTKHWPHLFIGEILSALSLIYWIDFNFRLIPVAFPFIFYAACIYVFRLACKTVNFSSIKTLLILLLTLSIACMLSALLLAAAFSAEGASAMDVVSLFASFVMGDFVGIILVLPLANLLVHSYQHRTIFKSAKSWKAAFFVIFLICMAFIITLRFPPFGYYVNLFAFAPAMFLAYRYEWVGAVLSIFVVNLMLLVTVSLNPALMEVFEIQAYLIGVSCASLLLGAAVSQLNNASRHLSQKNDELYSQLQKNQALASQLVLVQEQERKNIANQLHDDIGQNITALKLNIKVLEHSSAYPQIKSTVDNIDKITENTYDAAHELLYSLRPAVLEKIGLIKALSRHHFYAQYPRVNMSYLSDIDDKAQYLPMDVQVIMYRFVIECVNNAVKHSKASALSVKIVNYNNTWTIDIEDNGIGFDKDKNYSGFGLTGIEEKAMALNAQHILNTSADGTSHKLIFEAKDGVCQKQ